MCSSGTKTPLTARSLLPVPRSPATCQVSITSTSPIGMHTLRSPKDFTGPDLDIPSLTYQSWHEAKFGTQAWDDLNLIPKDYWADYLDWFRQVVGIPVRNEADLTAIAPAGNLLAAMSDLNLITIEFGPDGMVVGLDRSGDIVRLELVIPAASTP